MTKSAIRTVAALLLFTGTALAQVTSDPFPQPIAATEGVISAKFVEFATVRDSGGNDDTDGDQMSKTLIRVIVPALLFTCAVLAHAPQTPQAPGVTSD